MKIDCITSKIYFSFCFKCDKIPSTSNRLSIAALIILGVLPSVIVVADVWSPAGWEEIVLAGKTQYQFNQVENTEANESELGSWMVLADSRQSASGWIYKKKIDLLQTPTLFWAWQNQLGIESKVDEQSKQGDDFVARVYVIKKGFFPWQTLAISYVWSRQYPIGTTWPNPYTSNAMMVVVDKGDTSQWIQHTRNIREDFKRFFDKEVDHIDAIAFMTDTDNTKAAAKAAYRDIHFINKE